MADITANIVVSQPSQLFTLARSFKANANGKIYIGAIYTDPTIPSNQIPVYLENEDGSHVQVAQPIVINAGGYPVYNGQIAKFVTVQGHSMAIYDAYNVQQFYFPNVLKYDPDQLRQELNSSIGAGLVLTESGETVQAEISNLKSFPATGADNPYSPQDRARRDLYASDFGDISADIGGASNEVISSLATEYSASALVAIRGGEFKLPRGSHHSLKSINIEKHSSGVSSIGISGQGQQTSEINLSGSPVTTSGVTGGDDGPAFGELRDFAVKNSPNKGFNLAKYSRMTFKNLHSESGGSDGYYFGNGFVSVLEKLTAKDNAAFGVHFDATLQHTSHHINGGFASYNAGSGWYWGYMNYSVATAVASDNNTAYGHVIEKSDTFIANGCGAESNGRSGFAVLSSTARGQSKNIVINCAYAHLNGQDATGYPNLLYVLSQDNTPSQVRISKSYSSPRSGDSTPDIIADGIGAEVEIDDCTLPNGWMARNGGYIHWHHKTLLVRSKAIAASTATAICNLKSTQGHTRFSGTLTVLASNNSPDVEARNTAIYQLLVSKSILNGYQVIEIAKAGHITGGSASSPAFTFSIAADRLIATPIGSATGNFWFEIDAASQVVAMPI
ncbi:phage head-binding domain-containing protein [Pectobacterium brasiliense]|uniref:phage head-binding domain-containing protein n=1 Tax=Pectobacterium brasiliense TaxID=180957 RepID=UPI000691D416|nr:phage head-binding domain-containing protein [Pectobacterium brasiliense]